MTVIIIKKIEELLKIAKRNKNIIAVVLFGSFARGKKTAKDIDICMFLKKTDHKIIIKISSVSDKFDVHIFEDLPVYIRQRILKEGRIIYCSDNKLLYEIAISAVKEIEDYIKYYNNYMGAMKHGQIKSAE